MFVHLGVWACLDAFLYSLTFLVIRCVVGALAGLGVIYERFIIKQPGEYSLSQSALPSHPPPLPLSTLLALLILLPSHTCSTLTYIQRHYMYGIHIPIFSMGICIYMCVYIYSLQA